MVRQVGGRIEECIDRDRTFRCAANPQSHLAAWPQYVSGQLGDRRPVASQSVGHVLLREAPKAHEFE